MPASSSRTRATASRSAPAKTVAVASGRTECPSAIPMAGRAFPAAQPQTELTTINTVPLPGASVRSTSSGVRVSSTPYCVKSSRMRAMSCSGYRIGFENILSSCPCRLYFGCCQIPHDCIFAHFVHDDFVGLVRLQCIELNRLVDGTVVLFDGFVIDRNG